MIAGATVMAGSFGSIVDFVVVFVSVLGSGLGVVILLGRFWPAATWQGALAAILTGGLVSCLIEFLPSQKALWDQPILPATLAALLAHIAVSRLTPQRESFSRNDRSPVRSRATGNNLVPSRTPMSPERK